MDRLAVVEEFLALEEKGLEGDLDCAERARWIDLSRIVLGVPREVAERRRSCRVHAARPAVVHGPEEDTGATVLSLGTGGLFVATRVLPEPGTPMRLTVSLERPVVEEIGFEAEVRWVSRGGVGGVGGVGVAFTGLDQGQKAALLGTVRETLRGHVLETVARYAGYFDLLPEAVVVIGPDGAVTAANACARAVAGRSEASLLGTPFAALVHLSNRASARDAVAAALESRCPVRCELDLVVGSDPRERHAVEAVIAPFAEGRVVRGALVSCRERLDVDEVED